MDQDDNLLLKIVDGMKNEITEFLAELVKAKSVNPPGDTRDVIEVIRRKLTSAGLEVKLSTNFSTPFGKNSFILSRIKKYTGSSPSAAES